MKISSWLLCQHKQHTQSPRAVFLPAAREPPWGPHFKLVACREKIKEDEGKAVATMAEDAEYCEMKTG